MASTRTSNGGLGKGKQHFLLSAQARGLKLKELTNLSDKDAFHLFCALRWPDTQGSPVCPYCGCDAIHHHKKLDNKRRIFTCKACKKQFSVTSGTLFHGRKLDLQDILAAIFIFQNGVKGKGALELVRLLGVQYKTAFVLAHKIREALHSFSDDAAIMKGDVEIDGVYVGGHVAPPNIRTKASKKAHDRRKRENKSGKRRVIVQMRERHGRTYNYVCQSEGDANKYILLRIAPGSTVHMDEASSWDPLQNQLILNGVDVKRINHSKAYSKDGATTNYVESSFSRLRRGEIGIYHHISGPYIDRYAKEFAWREDARRLSTLHQFTLVTNRALERKPSALFKGYWQRAGRD